MTHIELIDKRDGKFIAPSADTINSLTPDERGAVDGVRLACQAHDAANIAAQKNAGAIYATQAEIAELERTIPRISRIDLVKEMSRETQLRRAGLI